MRVVIDTNVFISGTLWKGTPHRILEAWSARRYKLIVSESIVCEYEEVFTRLLDHDPAMVGRLIETVRMYGEFVAPVHFPQAICRDPDDDKFIAAAIAGRADFLVSGDKDLLVLGSVGALKIVSPRVMLSELA